MKKNLVARCLALLFLMVVLWAPLTADAQPANAAVQGLTFWVLDGPYYFLNQWLTSQSFLTKEGVGMDPDGAPAEAGGGEGSDPDLGAPAAGAAPQGAQTKEGVGMDPDG